MKRKKECHTLEVACGLVLGTGKGGLRALLAQQAANLLVGDVADLVVGLDDLAVLVADTAVAGGHERIASLVFGAYVAVDTGPAVVAFARLVLARGAVFVVALAERTADLGVVLAEFGAQGRSGDYLRGSRQSSPPKPAGQLHLPV